MMMRLPLLVLGMTGLAGPGLAADALAVEFVTVAQSPLTFDTALTGTIHAKDSVDVGFRQGGRVVEVMVNEGDRVRQGQPLARTDPLQQQQALRVAEASVSAATASQEQARQAQERARAMLSRGVGTRAELDAANQALSAAERALAEAIATRDQARRALEDTVIRTPADAIVVARKADPGQIVGAAQAVITLAASSGREAVFQTPDSPLLRGAMGAPVSLESIDFPGLHMKARVTEIAPLVDPKTASVTVRAQIDAPPQGVELLGSAVKGAVHFPAGQGIAVPWTALTATGNTPAVWRVEPSGQVALIPVRIARFADGTVILADGVAPGDIVVGAGSQLLYPGREVTDGHPPAGARQ